MVYSFDLHRDTGSGNGSSGVVLGGEDVAAGPGDLGTEGNEGLDEDGSLDGCKGLERFQSRKVSGRHTHVQATGDTGTLEGLVGTISAADGHETGHLNLGELDLAAAEGSQGLEA